MSQHEVDPQAVHRLPPLVKRLCPKCPVHKDADPVEVVNAHRLRGD